MKKLLYFMALAIVTILSGCDNEFAYPPVSLGEVKGQGTADDPYNVAKAIRVAAANGETSETFVFTAGYVVSGSIDTSYGNATFNIADSPEGATKELILYRIKDYDNKKFTSTSKVNIGDYIVVYAPLINFRGNTPETGTGGYLYSINGTVGSDIPDTPQGPTEASTPAGEGTIESPYNVAKALEVAKANGETSDKEVYTEGYVISGSIDTSYGNGTWEICDNASGTSSKITVYRCKDLGNAKFTDANKVKVGDKIVVCAPLINFKGNTPETNLGYLYSINGQTEGGSQTPTDQPSNPTGEGTEDNPYSVASVQGGATGTGVWVKGYIVGWVEGQVLSDGARFNSTASVATNLLIADSPDVTTVDKCVPVQLPTGDVRTALNLVDNPGNYKKEVTLKGSLEKYFGTAGIKSVTAFKIDGTGGSSETPAGETKTFRKASSVTSGKQYLMVASGKAATPLTGAYGYIQVVDVSVNGDEIKADANKAFTFTASGANFTISANGKYYYQTGTYNSFNVDATQPTDGAVWKVEAKDGKFVITNVSTSKTIQYDSQYTSYGCYPDERGEYPVLYEKVD